MLGVEAPGFFEVDPELRPFLLLEGVLLSYLDLVIFLGIELAVCNKKILSMIIKVIMYMRSPFKSEHTAIWLIIIDIR